MARSQVFTALLLAIISTAAGQYFQSGGTCCDLMDSDGWVILEHLNPIGEGRFNTLYIKLCSTSPVSVQLWEPSGNDWLLAWEKEYQIVDPSLAGEWAEISVADFDLTPEHRLGIYAKGSETIPVPYDYTTGTEPLSRSVENWYTPQFNIYNQDKSFTNIHFERSFINYVRFCYSGGEETECLNGNVPSVVVVTGPSGPQGPTGVPGPEGPVGPQGPPGAVCFLPDSGILFPPGASDVTDSVQNALGQIEANNAALSDKLDEISAAFANSNLLTGSCPPGFVSGSYGLGYCYLFMDNVQLSFGEALQHCHENYGALPVIIDSSLEEAFISTKIIQQMKDVEEDRMVWTAGLWSGDIDTWVWYSEMVETKKPMTYTNWLAGEPDLGLDGDQVCVAMSVIRGEDEGPYSYWTSEDCVRRNYFVCKIPKSCY